MISNKGAMALRLRCVDWSEDYNIGYTLIDNEHKLLFVNANEFIKAVKHGAGAEIVHAMLEAMIKYAKSHFYDEEMLMSQLSYYGYLSHKACHDSFLSVIEAFQKQFLRGDNITEELAYFMQKWLEDHVSKIDAELRHHIRGGGVEI